MYINYENICGRLFGRKHEQTCCCKSPIGLASKLINWKIKKCNSDVGKKLNKKVYMRQ